MFVLVLVAFCLAGCSKAVDVSLQTEPPKAKHSDYGVALVKLGKMTKILRTQPVKIQTIGVTDDTGVSQATGGDIPFDITEMIKSAVNRIGGKVTFVPYDPVFLKNQAALKFTSLKNKVRPNVVLHGGITEYDRALEVTGDSADFGGDFGAGKNSPGVDMGLSSASSTSSITLDINMMDFETMAMIPQVQAVNSIRVFKGSNEAELGFSLMGAAFGLSGSVKKIQGHHAAIRTLVDLSVLEVIGKYLNIPYWKCIGPEIDPDPIVMEHIRERYSLASEQRKILMLQQQLRIYGIPLALNGRMDEQTVDALHAFKSAYGVSSDNLDADFYTHLFNNAPIFTKSRIRLASKNPQQPELSATPKAESLQVQMQATKKEYHQGENIQISLSGNHDFYCRLIYVMSDGAVVQLLPNELRKDMRLKGGQVYTVPNDVDKFALTVAPPLGAEQIVMFASPKPLPEVRLQATPDGLGYYAGSMGEFAKAMNDGTAQLTIAKWVINTLP